MKTYVHIEKPVHKIHSSFTIIVKKWKQPKHPATDEQINKLGNGTIRRNQLLIYATIWMDNQIIILSEEKANLKRPDTV